MSDKTWVLLQATINETYIDGLNESVSKQATRDFSTSNSFLELLGLILLLGVILVATYFTTRFIGKYKMGQLKSSNFHVIDTYQISQSKMLQLIKVGNRYIVISICKDTITYITEIEEAQVITKDDLGENKLSFKQAFENLRNKK